MIYQQSIFGEELALTDQPSFREDSHASLSAWPVNAEGSPTSAFFGRKCSALSPSLARVGFSLRTYLESCELPAERFAKVWSVRDTISPYLIMKLRLSERRTGESESRLLPTPVSTLGTNGGPNQRDSSGRPELQMAAMLWPTPTTRDYKDGSAQSCANVPVNGLLGRAVHMLPTPTSQMAKHADPTEWEKENRPTHLHVVAGGQLNPTFVEWLMGFPRDWTEVIGALWVLVDERTGQAANGSAFPVSQQA